MLVPFFVRMFLTVVDAYSKWTEVCIMKTSTAPTTIEKMRGIFATHRLPMLLVSDNGPCFSSQEFKIFMRNNGIRYIFMVPYRPFSNGQARHSVRSFKEALKKMEANMKARLETKVNRFMFIYRINPHTTNGVPPAELTYKQRSRTAFHLMKSDTYQALGYKIKMERWN